MKAAILAISIVLVLGLFLTACSNAPAPSPDTEKVISETTPESYIDEQIINETEEVEIGEMI